MINMSIIDSWVIEPIEGITVKSTCYYVIRERELHDYGYMFDCRDGELTDDIMEANWYQHYKEAKQALSCFDEPDKFEIIRFNCTTRLEEIM